MLACIPRASIAAALTVFFAGICAAATPSFLCSKASTWVEKTICSSDRLSELDLDLAAVYARLLRGTDVNAKRSVESEQRKWWSERSQCQGNADPIACVEQSYTGRIAHLKARPDYPGDLPALGPTIIQESPIKEAGQGWARNLSEYVKAIKLCTASWRTPVRTVLSAWKEERGETIAMWLKSDDGQNLLCHAAKNGSKLKSLRPQEAGEDLPTAGPILYIGIYEPKDQCKKSTRVLDSTGSEFGWLARSDCEIS